MDYTEAKERAQSMADAEQKTCYVRPRALPLPGAGYQGGFDAWWYRGDNGNDEGERIDPCYRTIDDVRRRNARAGGHYFEPAALRFFASRVQAAIYPDGQGGCYFVTSERFDPGHRRLYTVRYADREGNCETAGGHANFQAWQTGRQAHAEAQRLAAGGVV
jgi:hypothetical protein